MKARTVVLSLALCLIGVAVCYAAADDVFMGTWKLNEAKSKFSSGAPKTTTVVYEASGDSVKITTDGSDSEGKPMHNEWTGKLDGNDFPLSGDPMFDTRSFKKVNDHTLAITSKKDGKVVGTGRVVVAADGKTRTVTTKATDSQGKKMRITAVYDKQ